MAITLNPGFVCILAALIVLAAPRAVRAPTMVFAALVAMWLMLDREFGAATAAAQMGLPVVLLNLDALNRIFGIAMLIALICISIGSGARRSRSEDAAIMLLAAGAVSALFVGDLVSFVAAAAVAGLATAWLVFASPVGESSRSGVRLLIWQGLEGLLFLVGVAFQLSAGAASSIFTRLDTHSIGGAFIFAALLVRVGAPFAHVWLKDAIAHASPIGGAAISACSTMLGVYALARLFPAEPLLVPIGLAMAVIGVVFALAEDDLRRAAASGLTSQTGVCVALVGIGSPLALAAAEGHAFTVIFAFVALQLALGAVLGRKGEVRASSIEGVWRTMPITMGLLTVAGLAAAGAPGLAAYVTSAIGLEALTQWQVQWAWIVTASVPAALLVALVLRPALQAYRSAPIPKRLEEAPFPLLLALGLALFFCLSIGFAPAWLFGLLPAEVVFQPYALDRLAPYVELMGAAGATFVLLRALRLTPVERVVRVLDVDALYRGPMASAGRWVGVVSLRIYGAWQASLSHIGDQTGRSVSRLARACDRPYRDRLSSAAQLLSVALLIAIALLWRDL